MQKYKISTIQHMVGPKDVGFGFDGSPKYPKLERILAKGVEWTWKKRQEI